MVDIYKFIKKHASIPFKLKRQESRTESTQVEGRCEESWFEPEGRIVGHQSIIHTAEGWLLVLRWMWIFPSLLPLVDDEGGAISTSRGVELEQIGI